MSPCRMLVFALDVGVVPTAGWVSDDYAALASKMVLLRGASQSTSGAVRTRPMAPVKVLLVCVDSTSDAPSVAAPCQPCRKKAHAASLFQSRRRRSCGPYPSRGWSLSRHHLQISRSHRSNSNFLEQTSK